MALFQRQPVSDSQPLYTLDSEKTILIIGLGNIGREYLDTRHNIGFDIIDGFADSHEFPGWKEKKTLFSEFSIANLDKTRVVLAKPTTYMNDSGRAVAALQKFYKVKNSDTLVIHDELDISFGEIRTKIGGGSAGHKGLESVIRHCNEDFGRLRIGIEPSAGQRTAEQMDSADFVLSRFSKDEQANLDKLQKEAINLLNEYVFGGTLEPQTRSIIL